MKLIAQTTAVLLMAGFIVATRAIANDSTLQRQALQAVTSIADKLMRDTRFAFKPVPQREELGMQLIDFGGVTTSQAPVSYAIRQAKAKADTMVHFGISGAGSITIWLNKEQVFRQQGGTLLAPKEFAYSRFSFNNGFDGKFRKGDNEIIIRYEAVKAQPVVLLRPQLQNGDGNTALDFNTALPFSGWHVLGPFTRKDTTLLPGQEIRSYYAVAGKSYNWQKPVQRLLPELVIDSTITYQRDAYADWHYANGTTVWSVMNLARETGDSKYLGFVKKYTGFILQNSAYFSKQYDSLFAFRGSFHRLFRQTMLDDAGAAVLPFIELYLAEKDAALKQVIDPVADYISNRQVRLKDGTFCRPEPTAFTVWADDLFMSVPFLLRMEKITGQPAYYTDAVKQFTHFRSYLLDAGTGLYRHGWYSATRQQSPVCWGRANGWIAWATAELLDGLPTTHPSYPAILAAFKAQMATLIKYQEKTGMWHQVLDRADSYEETSCTAIFTLVLARGVRKGWIDPSYKVNALNGWKAISSRIEADGTVHGICRGTEIGPDAQFYFDRKTIDQDPRGLGAVITAGMEIARLP
jgi:rhamnogalacturonyl hydrolase YesR